MLVSRFLRLRRREKKEKREEKTAQQKRERARAASARERERDRQTDRQREKGRCDMRGNGVRLLSRLALTTGTRGLTTVETSAALSLWSPPLHTAIQNNNNILGVPSSSSSSSSTTITRGYAVPKRKVSRSRKGMKANHPSKRIRSKKQYSYCETCDEVFGPHQICTGTLKGTCNIKREDATALAPQER